MNNQLKDFINGIGQLCEVWTIVYRSFVSQGMDPKDAIQHTQAFMTATMNSNLGKQNGT